MATLHRRLMHLWRAQPQCCATCASLRVSTAGEAACAWDGLALGELALTLTVCRHYGRSGDPERAALYRRLER